MGKNQKQKFIIEPPVRKCSAARLNTFKASIISSDSVAYIFLLQDLRNKIHFHHNLSHLSIKDEKGKKLTQLLLAGKTWQSFV